MELHERARQARLDAGMSINALAELMGVDRGIIQRMEWRPATTLQQLETQKKVVTLGPDGLMRAMVTAKSMKAKAEAEKAEGAKAAKAEPKAAPKKNPRFARTHAGRTCPVCGAVTNAPRFRFLCREHRTDENLKKFARKEVPAGTVEVAVEAAAPALGVAETTDRPLTDGEFKAHLENMRMVRDLLRAGSATAVPAPAPVAPPRVEVSYRSDEPLRGALAKSVVTLALTTMKAETSFGALAELALKALDEI